MTESHALLHEVTASDTNIRRDKHFNAEWRSVTF